MPRKKKYSWDEEEALKEIVEEIKEVETVLEVVEEVKPIIKEKIVSGITIDEKFPEYSLGEPQPNVVVIVKPDGRFISAKWTAKAGRWVKM